MRSWHQKLIEGGKSTDIIEKDKNTQIVLKIEDFYFPSVVFFVILCFLLLVQPSLTKTDGKFSWIKAIIISAVCALITYYSIEYLT